MGTHADDRKCTPEYIENVMKKLQTKYCKRFPQIRHLVYADLVKNAKEVKTGNYRVIMQIDWQAIKSVIAGLETMGEQLPQSYMELERLIKEEAVSRRAAGLAPIATWREFIKWGIVANITEENVSIAAQLFHDLV